MLKAGGAKSGISSAFFASAISLTPQKEMSDNLYKHRYGGLYRVLDPAVRYTDRNETGVLYRHLYPFESQIWFRPASEFFDGRFTEITWADVYAARQSMTQEEYQAMVKANKPVKKPEPEMVTITKEEFDSLTDDSEILAALDAGGVSSWEWYDASLEDYRASREAVK